MSLVQYLIFVNNFIRLYVLRGEDIAAEFKSNAFWLQQDHDISKKDHSVHFIIL